MVGRFVSRRIAQLIGRSVARTLKENADASDIDRVKKACRIAIADPFGSSLLDSLSSTLLLELEDA